MFTKSKLSKYEFTPEQMRVVEYIYLGYTNHEIAYDLALGVGGVKYHTNNIYRKLGVLSREACIVKLWKTMTRDSHG